MRRKLIITFIAVAAATGAATLAAAAPAPAPRTAGTIERDAGVVAAWVSRINDAMAPANAAMAGDQARINAIWAGVHDAASARAAAIQVRDLMQAERGPLLQAQSALASMPPAPPQGATLSGFDPAKVLGDARAMIDQLVQYNQDAVSLFDALGKGDMNAARKGLPTILRGALLMLDGRVILYRNRQATVPADQASHQLLGIFADLYRAMGVATRASYRRLLDHDPDRAAVEEKTGLAGLADEIAATTRTGRENLAHVQRTVLALAGRPGSDNARLAEKARTLMAAEERIFAAGDDLAAWVRAEERDTDAARSQQVQPPAMQRLSAIEQQMIAIQSAAAAEMAGGGPR